MGNNIIPRKITLITLNKCRKHSFHYALICLLFGLCASLLKKSNEIETSTYDSYGLMGLFLKHLQRVTNLSYDNQ